MRGEHRVGTDHRLRGSATGRALLERLLGREPGPSHDGWVYLGHRGDPQPRLVFQPVPEPKAGKARIHLDVTVDDVDEAIKLVTALGG